MSFSLLPALSQLMSLPQLSGIYEPVIYLLFQTLLQGYHVVTMELRSCPGIKVVAVPNQLASGLISPKHKVVQGQIMRLSHTIITHA